ncbi:MAG: Ig-like domain-containing protein, partial [Bacteroidales bacterium]|nr:Ig-like domain-containing protein [Bacteroidales bacterium]
NGGAEFTSLNTEHSASADLTGVLTAVTGSENGSSSRKYFWGVYPYSENNSVTLSGSSNYLTTVVNDVQYGVADSYSPGQNIWIGRDLGLELSFKSLLSGIKFTFSRDDIVMVTIKGNNGEYLAGKVNVLMDSGVPVVSDVVEGKTVLTLKPDGGGTFRSGAVYRALFLPTNFTDGLTVSFLTSDGTSGNRAYGKLNFERNNPKNAANADAGATWQPLYVEMGPKIFWATRNIGAVNPWDTGDYFAWGETEAKTSYSWNTYKWGTANNELTKYNDDSTFGTVDNPAYLYLQADDDAARVNLGPGWLTPQKNDWQWLVDNCDWEWTDDYEGTGTSGYVVTSTVSGYTTSSIFLPAAGLYINAPARVGRAGNYWSGNHGRKNVTGDEEQGMPYKAWYMNFTSSGHQVSSIDRFYGIPVRPMYYWSSVESVSLDQTSLTIAKDATAQLTATVLPESATNPAVTWSSSDETIATVSDDGLVTGIKAGTATITVTTVDGNKTASCLVMVRKGINGHVFVEMGDGLKWAITNVGATSEEEYGDYFAWGETAAKSDYSWSTYFDNPSGDGKTFTKYALDKKTQLDLSDDAASANWGGTWRMPTDAEWTALRNKDNFDWAWTGDYNGTGVKGRIVTSKVPGYEGNQIFLPATGYRNGTSLRDVGSSGYYWSSSLNTSDSYDAWGVYFSSGGVGRFDDYRCFGLSVRPVSE